MSIFDTMTDEEISDVIEKEFTSDEASVAFQAIGAMVKRTGIKVKVGFVVAIQTELLKLQNEQFRAGGNLG